MVFSNFVTLANGVPTRMHFTDYYYVQREVMDRDLGRPKKLWTHVFYVDTLGGEPTSRTFSILSKKLWAHLEPYVENNEYRDYDFIITEYGEGFYKDWNVQAIKRAGS